MIETSWVGDGEGKNDTMRSFIKRFSYISKAFLACCVPDVECDLIVIEFYAFYFEIYAYGTQVVSLK